MGLEDIQGDTDTEEERQEARCLMEAVWGGKEMRENGERYRRS